MSKHRSFGFSMIEVVAASAILLLLVGVVAPAIAGKVARARQARAKADLREIADAFNTYHVDTGTWPANSAFDDTLTTNLDLLVYDCLYKNTFSLNNWNGPYLKDGYTSGSATRVAIASPTATGGLLDPWGHPYEIYYFAVGYNSSQGSIVLVCAGANAKVDSTTAQIWGGQAGRDDLVQVVTRKM